jgi:uncharacterized protein
VPGAEEGLDLAGPMEGEVELTNTGAALLLAGEVRATITMECGRCLNPTIQPVEAELDEQFDLVTTSSAYNQEIVTAVDEDEPASVIENGNILNLGELLRQNLLLAAPLKPLCREDCPGIDIAGHVGVEYTVEPDEPDAVPEPIEESIPDNPLRRLADLMEAKRRSEENGAGNAG